MRVLGQVPHRAVAAGIEDRVVIRSLDIGELQGFCEHSLGRGILLEALGQIGLALRHVAFRVERRLTTFGRSEGQCCPGIEESVIGRGELLEPEASLATGVAELCPRAARSCRYGVCRTEW